MHLGGLPAAVVRPEEVGDFFPSVQALARAVHRTLCDILNVASWFGGRHNLAHAEARRQHHRPRAMLHRPRRLCAEDRSQLILYNARAAESVQGRKWMVHSFLCQLLHGPPIPPVQDICLRYE